MMVLVTGAASSGKSAYAEQVACALAAPYYYLAAMRPFGDEGQRRIKRHRALRAGKGFQTIECFNGLDLVNEKAIRDADLEAESLDLPGARANGNAKEAHFARGTALLESLGNVVANELFADDGTLADSEQARSAVVQGVLGLAALFENLVIVGDEVGGDGLRYDDATDAYIRVIGSAACALASRCDVVVECVAGMPLYVKGGNRI